MIRVWYDYGLRDTVYGGAFTNWQQALAIIPCELADSQWHVRRSLWPGSVDVIIHHTFHTL